MPKKSKEKPRVKFSYLGAPKCFLLEQACKHISDAFRFDCDHCGIYQVGSTLQRPDWRDVDVRMIVDDEAFMKLFPGVELWPDKTSGNWEGDPRWLLLITSISLWLKKQTGLPIDFQIQPMTHANAHHKGPRNALGMNFQRVKKFEDDK
jgi:hypothetical protein